MKKKIGSKPRPWEFKTGNEGKKKASSPGKSARLAKKKQSRTEGPERPSRSDRSDRPERFDRPDRSGGYANKKPSWTKGSERPSRSDRSDRPDRGERSHRSGGYANKKQSRTEGWERPSRPDRSDRYDRPAGQERRDERERSREKKDFWSVRTAGPTRPEKQDRAERFRDDLTVRPGRAPRDDFAQPPGEIGEHHKKVTWKPGTMLYPLPVVMVSCGDLEKEYNIITAAWTGIVCTNPAMCYISLRPERYSYELVKQHRQFCINLTTGRLAYATDWCGVKSGKDVDKFKEMNLTPLPCRDIASPLIAESPINLECRVTQVLPLGSHHMFLAEILAVHASERYLDKQTGALDLAAANLLSFAHGKYYQTGKFIGKFGFSVEKKKTKKKRKNRS